MAKSVLPFDNAKNDHCQPKTTAQKPDIVGCRLFVQESQQACYMSKLFEPLKAGFPAFQLARKPAVSTSINQEICPD
jgi:hypothetical protein